jgi:hypothetical protein
MADVEHSALTGSDLHEPKGIASAANNAVYAANGSGSGTWTVANNLNQIVLNCTLPDIDTDGTAWVVSPLAGNVTAIYTVIDGAIAIADATITPRIAGVAMSAGVITITQSGSAAGDVDVSTPTGNNTVTAGQAIEFVNDLSATNAVTVTITVVIDVSS